MIIDDPALSAIADYFDALWSEGVAINDPERAILAGRQVCTFAQHSGVAGIRSGLAYLRAVHKLDDR